MMTCRCCLGLLLFIVGLTQAVDWDVVTPLDVYVHRDDGYFSWVELASYRYEGVTLYMINMTSQKYQDESLVSHSIWWHFMGIAIPDDVTYPDSGFLFIEGGNNKPSTEPPEKNSLENLSVVKFANNTGTIGGYIMQVPNQPIVFSNDPTQRSRSEDWLIAWSWRTYIDAVDPDPEVILRMPMTKAAKRGLDAIYEVAKAKVPSTDVQKFIVSGGSKRGWTTWSLAATDQRVAVAAPIVFSQLYMNKTMMTHFRNLGGAWSFAYEPYYMENITQELFNPKIQGIFDVEDMYTYKERFTMPLLEMLSSGDEFFLLDDTYNWWNDFTYGPKYMVMLPNAEHSMAPHYLKIAETMTSFWLSYLQNIQLPTVSWELSETETGGAIVFNANPPPVNITAYRAVTLANDTRRDFRLASGNADEAFLHPVIWREDVELIDLGNGQYRVETENVQDEWVGCLVFATWEGPSGDRMIFTSQPNVTPYTFPVEACTDASSCYGTLV